MHRDARNFARTRGRSIAAPYRGACDLDDVVQHDHVTLRFHLHGLRLRLARRALLENDARRPGVDDDGIVRRSNEFSESVRERKMHAHGKNESRRGRAQAETNPARGPFRAAKHPRTNVGLPNLALARIGDDRGEPFELALSAQRIQTRAASRDMFAILVPFGVVRFTECDGSCEHLCAMMGIGVQLFSDITVRNVRMARQTRCRTASAVVPKTAAASCEE